MSCVLLLFTTMIDKHGDHEPHCQFYDAHYLAYLLHECRQLHLKFIAKKTFEMTNASLI